MRNRIKLWTFIVLLAGMVGYVIFILYKSNPKMIDNPARCRDVRVGDYVVIYAYGSIDNELHKGIVVQIDTTSFTNNYHALVRTGWGGYHTIITNDETSKYRIVGRGTFFHRANAFVGFNIMLITVIVIIILAIVVIVFMVSVIEDISYS